MRTFIAIDLSEDIKGALARVQSHLIYSGSDVKWVKPDNAHLTLKFLGEVGEDRIPEIGSVLDLVGKDTAPFKISLKGIGAFPEIDYPRVLWIGIDDGKDQLKALAEKIDAGLSNIGFAKESRPFVAHLTLGKVRSPKNKAVLKDKILSIPPQSTICEAQSVSSIVLFKSTLAPAGSIYTRIKEPLLYGRSPAE